ncbi:MAG: 3-hydroxybutyryl-CoA dehydrogenase [Deltaproteobacteria bacterium]|nr:3-hydroxybutyryl-CoA dehydrogenase [Deltaproteobacteria bacterium]
MSDTIFLTDKNTKCVGVIGAGQMGAGIAQVFASANFSVLLFDVAQKFVDNAFSGIKSRLERAVSKGQLTAEQRQQIENNIKTSTNLEGIAHADIIVEAIVENEEEKTKLFSNLDTICKRQTVLASNTSSISITKLAAATKRPSQVVGMHFMNPVPVMQLVELIRGLQTSDNTYNLVRDLTLKLNKTPVTAKRDFPGFIVNRILIPMLNEAVYVLMEGIASAEDIDEAMKLGTNQPMGPLALADFVGLDTCLAIAQIFHREFGDDKYRPCPLLVKYVEAGWLGRKTNRGFYQY